MDREKLAAFLKSPHRAFRWNGSFEGYDAVETTDGGLAYYRWSHLPDRGGRTDDAHQSFDAFLRDGPLREMPDAVSSELRALVVSLTTKE